MPFMSQDLANLQKKQQQDAAASGANHNANTAWNNGNYDAIDLDEGRSWITGRDSSEQYDYGGKNAQQFAGLAHAAQGQKAPTVNYANPDADRQRQLQALGMSQAAAMGYGGPSVAQQQLAAGAHQGMQAQNALANSAEGGARAFAGAHAAALRNQAMLGQNTAQQGAMLGAQEQAQARQAYLAQAAAMQGQDASQAQFGSALAQNQSNLNDQYATGLYGLGQGAANAQLQGGIGYEQQYANNVMGGRQAVIDEWRRQHGIDVQSASRANQTANGILGAGSSTLGTVASQMGSSGGGGGGSSSGGGGGGGGAPPLDTYNDIYGKG